jgi:hypothetical protein
MIAKTQMHLASATPMVRTAFQSRVSEKCEDREIRPSQMWLEAVAGMLEASLTNLNSLSHGFVPLHVQRMSGV